jgi:uncharacterized membrane protein
MAGLCPAIPSLMQCGARWASLASNVGGRALALGRIVRIFLSGILALLPIMVTVIVVAWVGSLVASYAGPGSFFGNLITSLGLNLSTSSTLAYFVGLGIILGAIFVLGLAVESGLRSWISNSFDWLMMRIPLVSNVYDLSKRFVAIVDRGGDEHSLKSMQPVWCFFGGKGSAAVLALMPSHEPVVIGEHNYVPVLVPSAPVPFGGALIYVPSDWIEPAEGGVERLMNVYVSMGVTPPISKPLAAKPAIADSSAASSQEPAVAAKKKPGVPRKPQPPRTGEDAS